MSRFLRIIDSEPYKSFLIILFLTVITGSIYLQVTSHSFILFDDEAYVYGNDMVKRGITIEGMRWAFGISTKQTYWHPLTWLSHMLDVQLFGLNSGLHHAMNVIFHTLNSVLLFIFLRNATGSYGKSAFVAALFAVHPVNVDSVAWLAERKNILSTTFWILSLMQYAYYVQKPGISRYIGLICTFALGLLAKPMAVTLPFVLLLLDYWPLRRFAIIKTVEDQKNGKARISRYQYSGTSATRLILEKIPLLFLSLSSILILFLSLRGGGVTTKIVPLGIRIENAMVSYSHYLIKLFWPHNLTFYYPFPDSIPFWQVIGSLAIVLGVSLCAVMVITRAPYFIVGWLWYLGTLVPVLGLMRAGLWPAIAERWAYVPFIGVYFMLAWGIPDLVQGFRKRKVVLMPLALVIILVLASMAWTQTAYWKDDFTLNTHGLEVDPGNDVAHKNLGAYHAKRKEYEKAFRHFEEAMKMSPHDSILLNNVALAYFETGDKEKSLYTLNELLRYDPNNIAAHYKRGVIYMDKREFDRAISDFSFVIRKDPGHVLALYKLGLAWANKGNLEKARDYLLSAVKINPRDPKIQTFLGVVLVNMGHNDEAIRHFRDALRIDPNFADAREKLAAVLSDKEGYRKKMNDMEALLEQQRVKKPDDPVVLHALAMLYAAKGEYTKALEAMNRFVDVQPENPEGYYNIACIYSRMSELDKSTQWLKKSIDKGFKDWGLLKKDKDLDNIRSTPYYKDLMNRVQG